MYKRGEVLTTAVFGLATLAMLGFYVLSVVRPEAFTPNISAPSPVASSTVLDLSGATATTNPLPTSTAPAPLSQCANRCSANEQCVEDWECAPCAVGEDGMYLGDCICEKAFNCQSL